MVQKDAVILAIEVSESMLWSEFGEDSQTIIAIKSACQITQSMTISCPKDKIGVLLFGTEISKPQDNNEYDQGILAHPHCYLLSNLDVPSAENLQVLRALARDENQARNILVPSTQPALIADLFYLANQIFTKYAQKYESKRLFVITDEDNPHEFDDKSRSLATETAKCLHDAKIKLEILPISNQGHQFDRSKFYDDVIYYEPMEDIASTVLATKFDVEDKGNPASLLAKLVSEIRSNKADKHILFFNLPFEIGSGLTISIKGFNLIHPHKLPRTCWVYDNGEQLHIPNVQGNIYTDDARVSVSKSDIKMAYNFGGSQVFFSSKELETIKFFEKPILRIIGFKPIKMLPFWASISKSIFIYPTEEGYRGSTRIFSALWKKLLSSEIMGIAWYIPKINTPPSLVAIIPSKEFHSSSKSQIFSAGLWLYTLPFADDIRSIPNFSSTPKASDSLIDKMRRVVQQLQLPGGIYDPMKYPNPSLHWHYQILQAMACGDDVMNLKKVDKTEPRSRQIHQRIGLHAQDWATTLEEQFQKLQQNRSKIPEENKRKRETNREPVTSRKKTNRVTIS
ncbi:Bgt-1901 [Blumeria graminis f. sp. tritici]|uniref:ATP-dependent DNA helicase II subunit 1 n=2 Tax=Blumeria graminis f. sp. tritici TaxID=62690 RepID=A0A9X9PQ65_BLUGR|nr:Subunit of the telomeric Ku complex [Blumeria graminis f. sp. tritici 96224]VCU38859.1 Bgt-1901 [Blumeria graminis f. sp. tritici]